MSEDGSKRGFVHLHVHSEYSMLDGASRIKDLVKKAAACGQPAIALTDHGYMHGVVELYKACKSHNDDVRKNGGQTVKPILGCEAYFTPDRSLSRDRRPELYHMILLAKDNEGYHNLIAMMSEAATSCFYYKPRITIDMLRKYGKGIIATSACIAGIVPQCIDRGNFEEAKKWARELASCFAPGDFYIELQDQGINTDSGLTQRQLNMALDRLAKELGLKTVGTNDIHYVEREDARTQDLMLCIGTVSQVDDLKRMRFANDQFYHKSTDEMYEALGYLPDCLENTLEVADKCNVTLEFDKLILPRYPFLKEGETNESLLREMSIAGLQKRYGTPLPQEVVDRFEHEYEIICTKGFAAYFLIVQEFAQWAKDQGIGVGPGRGSAAGSIISYALGITAFDPLANGLLFERFLSPERTEMPDIDMDFDDERRLEVVQHCRDIYGTERIASVITFTALGAKGAVNDAARVLGYSISESQRISKLIPEAPNTKLMPSIQGNPDLKKLYPEDADARKILEAALSLEGLNRGESVHASAYIICRDPVYEHVPVKLDTKGGVIITQFDGETNASIGLLKMDFLGLRTLTVISKCKQNIKVNYGIDIDEYRDVDFRDPAIYELFARGETAGVFQVESSGMVALLKNMKPDRYDDIVAVLALFRPGPLGAGMVQDFIDRKHGRKEISYSDDRLRPILENTYGTMVYQEQVMQISVTMSGFSMGESDKMRKAVAKKKIALMTETIQHWADGSEETMADHWLNGAVRNGYSRQIAQRIWDDVLSFAEYAFNKSHSAAYAILTMQTAWLKAHYRHEFMAAVLTSFMGKKDKIANYISACKQEGVPVLIPDINSSRRDFTPVPEGVRFGLAGLSGVGAAVADAIIAEREKNGPFANLHDFVNRVDSKACNKRVVEALIKGGAFDSTGYTRRQMMRFIEDDGLLEQASRAQRERDSGQTSFFDLFDDADDDAAGFVQEVPAPDGVEWDTMVKLNFEQKMLGRYVSGHPLSPYAATLQRLSDCSFSQVTERKTDGSRGVFAGMIRDVAIKTSKNGKNYANLVLEDTEGEVAASLFGKAFDTYRELLEPNAIVKVKCRVEISDRGVSLNIMEMERLELGDKDARPYALEIRVRQALLSQNLMGRINETLVCYPGRDMVTLFITQTDGRKFRAELPMTVNSASPELVATLNAIIGEQACRSVVV